MPEQTIGYAPPEDPLPPQREILFFDHASTTPVCAEASAAMREFEAERFGNPSSSHALGQEGAQAIGRARKFFARHFNVEPDQVIFTGGGTESDNLAIQGVALGLLEESIKGHTPLKRRRILYTPAEHPAVSETALALARLGFDPRAIPLDRDGQVVAEKLDELLSADETALVSIHQVNNILGTILPVTDLARQVKAKAPGALFHTDAVQAFGKVPAPTSASAVDFVSVSAHKLAGPKAVGALIQLNPRAKLRPLQFGGGQERALRSGTQSAGLITGFHVAAEIRLAARAETFARVTELRNEFISGLRESGLIDAALRVNSPASGVPHIVSLSLLDEIPAAAFAGLVEEEGAIVSTGSACHSGRPPSPEPALAAIGLPPALSRAGIRVSFSASHTSAEVAALIAALARAHARLSRVSGGGRRVPTERPGKESEGSL